MAVSIWSLTGALERPAAAAAKSLQSCPTLCNCIDGSPPGSPIPGILQARTVEWVAISFSNAGKWKMKVKSLSRVWLSVTTWTTRFRRPWDFPGKSTGVGFQFLLYMKGLDLSKRWWPGSWCRGKTEKFILATIVISYEEAANPSFQPLSMLKNSSSHWFQNQFSRKVTLCTIELIDVTSWYNLAQISHFIERKKWSP